jgi:hypothetical protein
MSLGLFEVIALLGIAATIGFLVVMSVTWDDTFGTGGRARRQGDPEPADRDQSSTPATERTAASTAATVSRRS